MQQTTFHPQHYAESHRSSALNAVCLRHNQRCSTEYNKEKSILFRVLRVSLRLSSSRGHNVWWSGARTGHVWGLAGGKVATVLCVRLRFGRVRSRGVTFVVHGPSCWEGVHHEWLCRVRCGEMLDLERAEQRVIGWHWWDRSGCHGVPAGWVWMVAWKNGFVCRID